MTRAYCFNYIEEKLNYLAIRLEVRGKLNILDLNIHSENFYKDFFNLLFDLNLQNLNQITKNSPAIDLIDYSKKRIVQVSSVNTKKKVQDALKKDVMKTYIDYNFQFIAISKDAKNLIGKTFEVPGNIKFNSSQDIFDIPSILKHITSLNPNKQKEVCKFLQQELKNLEPDFGKPDLSKIDSNLAKIINILSKEDLNNQGDISNLNAFDIVRKIDFNNLVITKPIINDYKIYYNRVDQKYTEFDGMGKNKSSSVLGVIQKIYIEESIKNKNLDDDNLFMLIMEKITEKVNESKNYEPIAPEELNFCVSILVVDAFIRCKIFKNPEDYNHVIA